jgi:hypothetical protein
MTALLAAPMTAPLSSASSPTRIVRSHQLEVYSTSGPWLIRTAEAAASSPIRRSIRIPDQAVRSVEWVTRATPSAQGTRACPP